MLYDIIGDIHGRPEKLTALLSKMGYQERAGAWRHPTRTALFVGDFIDRGPGQVATLTIVRAMVDAGAAIALMGNHEFNAIAWHTRDPRNEGEHLRLHTAKNRHQHAAFLAEVEDTPRHDEWVNWFMTLPLWLETPHIRAVHACWHPAQMAAIAPLLGPGQTLTPALLEAASRKGSREYEAVEDIVKGLEVDLPAQVCFTDKDGNVRRRTRVRWWDETATTYRAAALVGLHDSSQLPETPIPESSRVAYDNLKPVFFGHYWFTGNPVIVSPKACCVDYSAARDGEPLVAYRYSGEQDLTPANLVSALPTPEPQRQPRATHRTPGMSGPRHG
jgi:hypothetical protein